MGYSGIKADSYICHLFYVLLWDQPILLGLQWDKILDKAVETILLTDMYYSQTKWNAPLKITLMNSLFENWTR